MRGFAHCNLLDEMLCLAKTPSGLCFLWYNRSMPDMLRVLFVALSRCVQSRRDLVLKNLALRQQLAVFAAKHPGPSLGAHDRLFWVVLRRLWAGWKKTLFIVQPETVIRWHRAGFKVYWKWISHRRQRVGRRPAPKALRELIFRMFALCGTSRATSRKSLVTNRRYMDVLSAL